MAKLSKLLQFWANLQATYTTCARIVQACGVEISLANKGRGPEVVVYMNRFESSSYRSYLETVHRGIPRKDIGLPSLLQVS